MTQEYGKKAMMSGAEGWTYTCNFCGRKLGPYTEPFPNCTETAPDEHACSECRDAALRWTLLKMKEERESQKK